MKLDSKTILNKLYLTLGFVKKYIVFIFAMVIMVIFSFFVFRINQYSNAQPTEDSVNAKLQTVQRPKIDQSVLTKIQNLESQNIQVHSLFDEARNNPFSE